MTIQERVVEELKDWSGECVEMEAQAILDLIADELTAIPSTGHESLEWRIKAVELLRGER